MSAEGNTYECVSRVVEGKYTRMCRMMYVMLKVLRRHTMAFSVISSVPSLGSFSVARCGDLENTFPHAWALRAEALSRLSATARSLLAKVFLDRQTGELGDGVLGGL